MISASGIAYRWFSSLLAMLVGGSTVLLYSIKLIGVERFSKIPVFGYVAKRFSAFITPLMIYQILDTNWPIPITPW